MLSSFSHRFMILLPVLLVKEDYRSVPARFIASCDPRVPASSLPERSKEDGHSPSWQMELFPLTSSVPVARGTLAA